MQDDDAISFDIEPSEQERNDTGTVFESKSLSTHDLQTVVDSEVRDVSNVIGLEVRRPQRSPIGVRLPTRLHIYSVRNHFHLATSLPLGR